MAENTNEKSNVIITGTAQADSIANSGSLVTINAGKGNDTVYLYGGFNFIYKAGDGNDLIKRRNSNFKSENLLINLTDGTLGATSMSDNGDIVVKIGKGSLTFKNAFGDQISFKDSKGKVTVIQEGRTELNNTEDNATLNKTSGSWCLTNGGSKVEITTNSASDAIKNTGSLVSIAGGKGNDTIDSIIDSTTIDGGFIDGNDSIFSNGSFVTINGGAGKDQIHNGDDRKQGGSNVSIAGGKGNDTIDSIIDSTTIDGGSGNDVIQNWYNSSNVSIGGGKGDDAIYIYEGSLVTINGGSGNDSISLGSSAKNILIEYTAQSGNDLIQGFNANSTLSISGGAHSTKTSGKDLIVTVGKGKISLLGAASLSTVNIVESPVSIDNSVGNKKLVGTNSNDTITNYGKNVTIQAQGGNDYIYNCYGDSVTIDGGTGNDEIWNIGGSNVSIDGGTGNDYIFNNGQNVSISGGKGDDSLWGGEGKDTFIYSDGDGKDIIYRFDDNDLLKITEAFSASYDSSKSEVYFKVGSTSNAITLRYFTATSFNVNGENWHISNNQFVKK